MSHEVARFECETCGAKFLKRLALQGHQSVHTDETAKKVVNGP